MLAINDTAKHGVHAILDSVTYIVFDTMYNIYHILYIYYYYMPYTIDYISNIGCRLCTLVDMENCVD
jgi:hypothetical protein